MVSVLWVVGLVFFSDTMHTLIFSLCMEPPPADQQQLRKMANRLCLYSSRLSHLLRPSTYLPSIYLLDSFYLSIYLFISRGLAMILLPRLGPNFGLANAQKKIRKMANGNGFCVLLMAVLKG